jgi:hypothetical protein
MLHIKLLAWSKQCFTYGDNNIKSHCMWTKAQTCYFVSVIKIQFLANWDIAHKVPSSSPSFVAVVCCVSTLCVMFPGLWRCGPLLYVCMLCVHTVCYSYWVQWVVKMWTPSIRVYVVCPHCALWLLGCEDVDPFYTCVCCVSTLCVLVTGLWRCGPLLYVCMLCVHTVCYS